MNTTAPTAPIKATSELQDDGTLLGIFVMTAHDFVLATHLVAPLRHIFRTALRPHLSEWVFCCAVHTGVIALVSVNNVAAALETIQKEIKALHYESVAHVGQKLPVGWHALVGSSDVIMDFTKWLGERACGGDMEMQSLVAHFNAANEKQ